MKIRLILLILLIPLFGCQLLAPSSTLEPTATAQISTLAPEPTAVTEPTAAALPPTPAPTETTAPPTETSKPDLVITTQAIVEASDTPKYEIDVQYPILEWGGDSRVDAFNEAAQTIASEEARLFKEGTQVTIDDPYAKDMLSTLKMAYTTTYSEHGLVSVLFNVGYYMAGAAHPGYYAHTLTYDVNGGKQLALDDIFQPGSNYLEPLSQYCIEELRKRDVLQWEDGALPKSENYRNWNLTPDGLMITFDEYQVASHAAGPQTVIVPYTEIQALLAPEFPLGTP